MTELGLAEVGAAVSTRRLELAMNRSQLAGFANVSVKTLASFESGLSWPRQPTRTRIETALGWPIGTLFEVRSGAAVPTIQNSTADFAELDDLELWQQIEGGRLDARRRAEALAEYEKRQIDLLPRRLEALSRRGLMVTSRYVSILLETDEAQGFRRKSTRDEAQ